ncbi:MAG: alpha-galactosidase [Armatimonadetes bacterium]|nr:alpha-galactosidase [Armatimonadota bacterium]
MHLRFMLFLAALVGVFSAHSALAVEPAPAELSNAHKWTAAKFTGKQPASPFSFIYEGRQSTDLLKTWKLTGASRKLDSRREEHKLTYVDPATGLQVRCVATEYHDFPAVEWVLHFKNSGKSDTPILENVQALNADIGIFVKNGDFKLYYAEGSHEKITDFQPLEKAISPDGSMKLGSFGGRSSDGFLPFVNLAKPDGGGVVIGIGWTGQWAAAFARAGSGSVNVRAGMEITHLKLHPGEEVRTPAILMMFWSGQDRMRGQNLLKKLLLSHYTPKPGGKPADPPFAMSPHGVVGFEDTTEVNNLEAIANLASHKLIPDYWWIDAGWFPSPKHNWAAGVGTWDPDPERYPNGMKPVADAAHKAGMKFLLWFEPERVMPGTWLHENHHEWLMRPTSDMPPELQYMFKDEFHLLNLGNPEALTWLKKKVSDMIGSVGIDCYRNDFNLYPVYFWRNGEDPDRQGINEIRYVMGLYDYFDTLQREHPNLLIDNCASGGRRIDFEMLRRALVLTRSDYLWDPIGQQCHTYGLAQWVPITGIGSADINVYNCRSGLGSHFAFASKVYSKDQAVWDGMLRAHNEYKSLKKLYTGDFYPLGSYSNAKDVWMAWQFDRHDLGAGVFQAFRRQDSPVDSATYRLRGLEPAATYIVTNVDEQSPRRMTGRELMEKGLTIDLPNKLSATVITYKRTSN